MLLDEQLVMIYGRIVGHIARIKWRARYYNSCTLASLALIHSFGCNESAMCHKTIGRAYDMAPNKVQYLRHKVLNLL